MKSILALTLAFAALAAPALADPITATLPAPVALESAEDYEVLTAFATPYVPAGTYALRITGIATPSSVNAGQYFIKPTFGMPGAPALSAAELRQVAFHGSDMLSYAGGLQSQTATSVNEQGLDPSTGGDCFFVCVGTVTVSSAGYLSMAAGGFIEANETWTLNTCTITLTPQ